MLKKAYYLGAGAVAGAANAFAVGAVSTENQSMIDNATVTVAAVIALGFVVQNGKAVLKLGKRVISAITGNM